MGRQVGDMGVDGIRSCLPGRKACFISLRGSNAVVEAAVHLVWEHEQLGTATCPSSRPLPELAVGIVSPGAHIAMPGLLRPICTARTSACLSCPIRIPEQSVPSRAKPRIP